jgi:prolyl-tRNA editing enzyme YbaK/EbsC (Cys-tRNA(Pro) deacylase)
MDALDTPVLRLLNAHQIAYRWLRHSQPVFTVEEAARQRGVVLQEMVKSILLRDRDGRYVMACVPGSARVNLNAVRAQLPPDWKRLTFASAEEILAVTGCVQGAVAPLGLPETVPVIFDEAIARCHQVNISSGDPHAGLELPAADLIRLAGARLAPIAERE